MPKFDFVAAIIEIANGSIECRVICFHMAFRNIITSLISNGQLKEPERGS